MKLRSLMKKDFLRFFCDFRLILTMLLPGIVIYAVYSIMGSLVNRPVNYDFKVYCTGESQIIRACIVDVINGDNDNRMTVTLEQEGDAQAAKTKVSKKEITAYIVIPEGFDEKVTSPDGQNVPNLIIYYNSSDRASQTFYNLFVANMTAFKESTAPLFTINAGTGFDLGENSQGADILGGILPFLIVTLIFSFNMSITLESVAGEKERGTLATVLVTSVKRSHVALGKIIPLSCISAIGALSGFLGVVLSLPKLMGISLAASASGYGFLSYFMLFLIIIGLVPLIVSIVSIFSTYSKTVKEASAYAGVVMVLVMVLSLVSSFLVNLGDWVVAVPVLNAVVAMQAIFAHNVAVWMPFTVFGINLLYTALLVFLIAKMLSSERIMFGK